MPRNLENILKNTANKFAVLDREVCLSKPRKPTISKRILDFWLLKGLKVD